MLYSAYVAAALSLLLVTLSLNISRLRLAHKVSFGDGGIRELTLAVRAHGNSLEQSVIFIPLLYFMEANGNADARISLGLGSVFVLTRIIYCAALFKRTLLIRQMAHAVTVLLQIATAVILLVH